MLRPDKDHFPDTKNLTEKQFRFCEFYIQNGGNGADAARKAGYSPGSAKVLGSSLMKEKKIIEYIKQRTVLRRESSELVASSNEVLETLTTILREGKNLDKLRAAELLGKSYGMYVEKTEDISEKPLKIIMDNKLDSIMG